MAGKRETEVLVAGAGPVGLYAALFFAERGVKVRVIDEQHRGTTRSYALALHPRTLELLDEMGLTAELVAAGQRVDTIAFYGDGRRQCDVHFRDLRTRYPFVLVLPQSAFEAALDRRLHDKGIEVEWSHRLAGLEQHEHGVAARVHELGKESVGYAYAHTEWVVERESTVHAAFVIGADGHQSRVRRELGFSFDGVGTAQNFAVFEFAQDKDTQAELAVVLDERTSVLWPLGPGRLRWSFEVGADEAEAAAREKSRLVVMLGQRSFQYLDPSMLRRLQSERAPWFTGSVRELAWSIAIRFERRLASELGRGNVWLAGDAAHLAPPMGIQSMNEGLWEVRELGGRIRAILREGGARDALVSFGQTWHAAWRARLAHETLVRPRAGASEFARRRAARIYDCLPASGEHMAALLGQLEVDLA